MNTLTIIIFLRAIAQADSFAYSINAQQIYVHTYQLINLVLMKQTADSATKKCYDYKKYRIDYTRFLARRE